MEGKSFSFAKTVASKVLDAAYAAKDKKKKINDSGHEAPKGLFANELKKQFITNPYKDFTKKINKNIEKKAKFVGLFSDGGEKFINKFKIGKKKPPAKPSTPSDSPKSGGGGGAGLSGIGSIVLDIEQLANSFSNLTSLFNTNLGLTYKMSGGLADIKNILSEQLSLQKEKISRDEMRAREASLENSQQNSGSVSSTSTIRDEGLLGMFGDLKNLLNMIKSLPEMIGGFIKAMISKLPGGAKLLEKLGGAKRAVAGGVDAVKLGGKGLLKGVLKGLKPGLKAIPFGIGGLLDFGLNMLLGEPPGKAAAKAVGSTIGSSLGAMVAGALGLVGGPAAIATGAAGAVLGGVIGDTLGGAVYDLFAPKDNKMSGGGVMIGEAGPEMVTPLNSAMGQGMMGGGALDDAYAQPYNAVAGGMLAVTKDFVEGMGPIGSMVAPAIQNDVDKLGRVFDIPSTSTNIEVGGANLRANPLAEREGKKYMQDLVEGSLKKLSPEKKKDKESSTGSSGGSGGTTPSSSDETGGTTPADNGGTTPTKPPETNEQYAQRQLKETVSGVNPTMVPAANAQGYTTIDQFNVANPNFERVKYDTGNVAEGYFYDSKGNIYQIKEDGTRRVISNDKTILKKGVPNGWMNERMNFFQRNLRDGRVTLSHKPTIGAYDYASNGVYTRKQRLSAWADESNPGAASNMETYAQITPVSKYDPTGTKFNASQPYGPVPQTSMGRPNDPGKGKAESGIKAVLTLSGGTWPNLPVHSFSGTKPHHGGGDESDGYGGFKRDYLLQKPNAKDGVLAGPSHKGAPVPAGMKGYVEVEGGSVNAVRIWDKPASDPTRKMRARFLHFDSIRVKTGDQVNPGTILGGQGNKPNYDAYHVHLEASAKDQDQWIKTVDAMIAGGQLPSDSENPSDPGVQTSDDPFEAMNQAIQKLSVGLGLSAAVQKGMVTDEASFKSLQDRLSTVASDKSPSAASDKASAPAHFERAGGGGGVGGSSTQPSPAAPPRPAATPMGASGPAPATQSPQVAVVGAPVAASSQVAVPSSRPNMTPAGMSDDSFASLDSTAMTLKPFTYWVS